MIIELIKLIDDIVVDISILIGKNVMIAKQWLLPIIVTTPKKSLIAFLLLCMFSYVYFQKCQCFNKYTIVINNCYYLSLKLLEPKF